MVNFVCIGHWDRKDVPIPIQVVGDKPKAANDN